MNNIFKDIDKIQFEGAQSDNPLAFHYYDPDQLVLGKTMAEHLRFAVCYWHTFCWQGNDPFGGQTMFRPWFEAGDPVEMAELKMDVAFEFFQKLGTAYFCFHDRDVAPEGSSLRETNEILARLIERMEARMDETGLKLLWGTANLFSHHRYMSGAATNPNPEVVAYAAAQVRNVMDITHRLNGEKLCVMGWARRL